MITKEELKQWFIDQYIKEFGSSTIVLDFSLAEWNKVEATGKLSFLGVEELKTMLINSMSFEKINDIKFCLNKLHVFLNENNSFVSDKKFINSLWEETKECARTDNLTQSQITTMGIIFDRHFKK